ncbi:MAG: histidine phosphatase family protein [Siculibacillus sp.]|nr:histidine phosphatase family protein [Siculibacillus sp.]
MPRLLLLRHAKSSWDDVSADDFDRPLNDRGRLAAPVMGSHLAAHGLAPDRILCSSARRARETLAALLPHLDEEVDVRLTRDLYFAGEDRMIDQIRAHGGNASTLLVIGHNPGIQETALAFLTETASPVTEAIAAKFPTTGLAIVDFPAAKWVDIEPRTGRAVAFLKPRGRKLVEISAEDEPAG